jgi:hypothetical protein
VTAFALRYELSLIVPDLSRCFQAHRQSPSPRDLQKRVKSQGPLLHRHYPASTLIRPCPTPAVAVAVRNVEAATLATDGSPPITRTTVPTCRAQYPGGSSGCACRFLPRSHGLPPTGVHNARCLTFELTITYPFHPLVGQSVLVVGDKEHGGTRHLIICTRGGGARLLLPEWMTFPEAAMIRAQSYPRLPVGRLVELRALLDRLMVSSPGNHVPGGGQSNETLEAAPTRSVYDTATTLRSTATATYGGSAAAHSASGGGDVRCRSRKRRGGKSRGAR